MAEFTNFLSDIHMMWYRNDREAEAKQQAKMKKLSPDSQISRMKGYCGDNTPIFKYEQEPVLYKPMIKDIVHGGTCDRVFSKTVTFKKNELRCSDGIVLPENFLDLMDVKQRNQAMALYERGLLVVSICSATTFFSKRNKQLKETKKKFI